MANKKTIHINGKPVAVKHDSESFSIGWKDGLRAFLIAVLTPVLYVVQELIPGWHLDPISKAAISAGVAYLIKNFFTPGEIVIDKKTL